MDKLPAGMNWYLVKVVYQVITGKGNHKPQFDEQFRLIMADEMAWAWEKASVIARMSETTFINCNQELVQWKFIAVEEVCPIGDLEDGEIVYSSTEEPHDIHEYMAVAKGKSHRAKASCTKIPVSVS